MSWMNSDGLFVKFGKEEAAIGRGGTIAEGDQGRRVITFTIDWKDVLSATAAVLGSVGTTANPQTGSMGVWVPEGFIPEQMETTALVAFTSSGTIGSSTLVIGLKKASDRSTDLNADGLTTTAFVGSLFDATNENQVVKTGSTGCGDQYGIALTENAVISVSNSAHASHPYTAGVLRCRLMGRYGLSAP